MSSEDSSSSPSGPKIGQILKQARIEQGLSLQQVEQATKIRARYLEELERGNFGVLPAVYVRGSLRTYADHLRLDGEALTRELKHWQPSPHERRAPMYGEPSKKSDADRSLISLDNPPAGAGDQGIVEDKGDARPTTMLPMDSRYYLYVLGSGALVVSILAAAVALASTPMGNDEPTVSQVLKPMASPVTLASDEGSADAYHHLQWEGDEPGAGDEGDGRPLREQAGSPPDGGAEEYRGAGQSPPDEGAKEYRGAGQVGQIGQDQGNGPHYWAGDSRDTTTTASSPTTIEVAPATTKANTTPTPQPLPPTTAEPAPPATTEVTVRNDQDADAGVQVSDRRVIRDNEVVATNAADITKAPEPATAPLAE
jgi:transcriptional regulator with XRE-family HTH domain